MDKLRGMETFIAVVEYGSFTEAASHLEMSAVMVGKYIALIERRLATRLLERNTRRQSLTDAGRVYYEEAKRVLEQVSIAESSVERLRLAPAGTLRISAPTSFGACVMAPLTATFLQRWPDVRVELDLTNRLVDLVDEGFDLAVRIGDIHQTDLVAKYLCAYRMVICAAPAYLSRHGTPLTPARPCRPSLPLPYGVDRAQRVEAAGHHARGALAARCDPPLQRRLRPEDGGHRRSRPAAAAGSAVGGGSRQRKTRPRT
ncbi:D-malate degradation protein R [Raoultella terrigena]|uniref:D-malate degradation protein R n=1 Tax=Raoultella terrigena TaxID=577 RepID=A0A3P8K7F3_RAOTE|nr:D-malate degradation protein R [Raoultella terrigena]